MTELPYEGKIGIARLFKNNMMVREEICEFPFKPYFVVAIPPTNESFIGKVFENAIPKLFMHDKEYYRAVSFTTGSISREMNPAGYTDQVKYPTANFVFEGEL